MVRLVPALFAEMRWSRHTCSTWTAVLLGLSLLPHHGRGDEGILWITMISHFDRPWSMTEEDVRALERLSDRHPSVRWTHLFNPAAYTQDTPLRERMEKFVVSARDDRGAEIGVHTHMYRSLVEAAGVVFRETPSVSSPAVQGSSDKSGYAVPMSRYTRDELLAILTLTERVFDQHGLGRPRTFCAGFYATSLDLQKAITERGYTASAAAFPQDTSIGHEYSPSWHVLAGWERKISHVTPPYRVSTRSILPGGPAPYLRNDLGVLVEIPQTCKIDWMVSAEDMLLIFRENLRHARQGKTAAVCLAIHETSSAQYQEKFDEVLAQITDVAEKSRQVDVRFVTCQELRKQFLESLSDK